MTRRWKLFLLVALVAGLALRLLYASDMEYKEDEEFNFVQSQLVGGVHPWPAFGMPSGVYIPNPGMSVWVFAWLARLTHATTPTGLAHALGVFSVLGIALVIPFAARFVAGAEREAWLWACALALVNPLAIMYQRKLWPEPFLPFFTMLLIMGWWRRERKGWAGLWGFVGAIVGQIHMSGFFLAAALVAWTAAFAREPQGTNGVRQNVKWGSWALGSAVGTLPMLPWLVQVLKLALSPAAKAFGGPVTSGLGEAFQLKYWVFWISDPFGLHVGNTLGLLRGQSHWAQLSDFVRYPLVAGHATYVVGLAHLVLLGALLWTLARKAHGAWAARNNWKAHFTGEPSQTTLVQNAAFFGCGALMTATTVAIRRYYLMVTFPLEFVWLARASLPSARKLLVAVWLAELVVSAGFVGYVHVNQGSTMGDYGKAFHVLMDERRSMGPQ